MGNFWPGRSDWCHQASSCLFFDSCCMLCARRGQSKLDLCKSCEDLLTERFLASTDGFWSGLCTECGDETTLPAALRHVQAMWSCEACRQSGNPLFSAVVAPYRYEFPLDALIQRMKYHSDRTLSRALGTLLAKAVQKWRPCAELPDILLPMPLHARRLRHRGYNQAQDIARWCGKKLSLDVNPLAARRIIDTPSMAAFGRAERQHHILGAFRAADYVAEKHIAIVDDVMTTGASARELARELYDTGAESVELWVLARTSSPRETD